MCKHVNIADEMRKGMALELPEPPSLALRPARFETLVDGGGISNIGLQLYAEMLSLGGNAKIGTMVAGNSGRPGGACGFADGTAGLLHAGHYTQEEDVVANWLSTVVFNATGKPMKGGHSEIASAVYASTICGQWGMLNPNGDDALTVQQVDYTNAKDGSWYGDAWVVEGAALCAKKQVAGKRGQLAFDPRYQFPCTLVFVAGPNCGQAPAQPSSTMRRTFNHHMQQDYDLFRQGVQGALRAGLYAMARERCDIVLLAHISAGIYAGPWRQALRHEFGTIVNELLAEEYVTPSGKRVPLGRYFTRVVLTLLQPELTAPPPRALAAPQPENSSRKRPFEVERVDVSKIGLHQLKRLLTARGVPVEQVSACTHKRALVDVAKKYGGELNIKWVE